MYLLLILPILVSGFIFCNNYPAIYYKLHRYEGQYLYLQSAKYGLIFLLSSLVINQLLLDILYLPIALFDFRVGSDYITILSQYLSNHKIEKNPNASIQAAWIISISILMMLTPYLYCLLHKKFALKFNPFSSYGKLKTGILYEILKDSPLDKLLIESLVLRKQILFSMNDKKVYVGVVIMSSEPNEADGANQEIAIKPILSGYRDKENQTVTFTTVYDDLDVDFSLVLKQENISTATEFDFKVYEQFSKKPNRRQVKT
jgi:hypothetical protein